MTKTFARLLAPLRRAPSPPEQTSEPEVMAKPRPMTSFFDSLTAEQRAQLRVYGGPENHGPDEHRLVSTAP